MAILKNLRPNQVLYKVRKEKAGNTTMTRQVLDEIRIVSVDLEAGTAIASSFGSRKEHKYYEWQLKSWRVNEPQVKGRDILGNPRY
jgi:hypothetical protein